ncbi:MAG: hypothetical protein JO040_09315, partial [Gemmatimonadetes bacterium]|nr:hypothetical protein [Gemmatimonadota bacterium]
MKRSLKRLPHLGALLFVLAAAPAHVAAQDPAPPAAGEQAGTADALRRLKPGTLLRVHTSTAGRVEGPLVRVTPEALVVGVAGGERILPLADLRSVWARGRQTRRGAKLGAVAGGVGGLVFSGFIAALASAEGEDSGDIGQFVLGSTALSAAGGALVGGIAGAAFPRWRRVVGTGSEDEPSGDESLGTVPEGGRRFASVETTLGFAR